MYSYATVIVFKAKRRQINMFVEVENVCCCVYLLKNNDMCVNCASTCYTAKKAGLNWF